MGSIHFSFRLPQQYVWSHIPKPTGSNECMPYARQISYESAASAIIYHRNESIGSMPISIVRIATADWPNRLNMKIACWGSIWRTVTTTIAPIFGSVAFIIGNERNGNGDTMDATFSISRSAKWRQGKLLLINTWTDYIIIIIIIWRCPCWWWIWRFIWTAVDARLTIISIWAWPQWIWLWGVTWNHYYYF